MEGIRHVGEAIEAGGDVRAIFYAPDSLDSDFANSLIEEQSRIGMECLAVTAEVFATLAERENPQGILAVVQQPERHLEELTPANFPWGVALVAPQDPGNLGAILRTIDAVGASGLLLIDGGVEAYHPSAVRASMGALFWHPVVSSSFDVFAEWVREHGFHVYGTSPQGALDYRQVGEYKWPRILLMGSERQGLAPDHMALCEKVIRLPMLGRATSLNLAVSAGIFLYEMLGDE